MSRNGRVEASFSTMSLPIAVKAAVSPDDVLWENLGKFYRQLVFELFRIPFSSPIRARPRRLFV